MFVLDREELQTLRLSHRDGTRALGQSVILRDCSHKL
jgi:hypothetical protein